MLKHNEALLIKHNCRVLYYFIVGGYVLLQVDFIQGVSERYLRCHDTGCCIEYLKNNQKNVEFCYKITCEIFYMFC